ARAAPPPPPALWRARPGHVCSLLGCAGPLAARLSREGLGGRYRSPGIGRAGRPPDLFCISLAVRLHGSPSKRRAGIGTATARCGRAARRRATSWLRDGTKAVAW